jgi:hypothetical protein
VGKLEDIINACAKTPKILREKQEKITAYNIIIVPIKNLCREKLRNKYYLILTLPR